MQSDKIPVFLLGRARHPTGADLRIFLPLKGSLWQGSGDEQDTGSQRSPHHRTKE